MIRASRSLTTVSSLAVLTLLGACSAGSGNGPGDAGKQSNVVPLVKITPIGHQPASDGSITVRSGSEVILTGKDSDGIDAPLLSFEWSGADPDATALLGSTATLRPNSTSIRFVAPPVPVGEQRTLGFRLQVTNSRQETATSTIQVKVSGVDDSRSFLTYLDEPRRVTLAAALKPGQVAPASVVPLSVTMRSTVTYRDTTGALRTLELPSVTKSASWDPAAGITEQCASDSSPRFVFDLPELSADAVNATVQRLAYQQTNPDARRQKLTEELYVADIDQAELMVRLELLALDAPGGGLSTSSQAVTKLCALRANGSPALEMANSVASEPTVIESDLDGLRVAMDDLSRPSFDTRASALDYYAAIDPHGYRETLLSWLGLHGFDISQRDYGASVSNLGIAHATYLNNIDLGFGREMYSRLICEPGVTPSAENCDVAAVVLNYPSLEAAAKKQGALVAVAMEYSKSERRPGCVPSAGDDCLFPNWSAARSAAGRRFTKFFAFAPDPRTGEFRRVTSVNLDGRGEKFVPQSCTVCHGGVPYRRSLALHASPQGVPGKTTPPEDVDAGFLLWDDKTLLFGDEEPAYAASDLTPADRQVRESLSRSRQSAAIKALNLQAYLTFSDPPHIANRFQDARALVETWYGGPAFPGSTQASARPPGWAGAPNDAYDAYATYCRTCHVLHAPAGTLPGQFNFPDYDSLSARLNHASLAKVLEPGLMPGARLTYDRFWTKAPGSAQSAGERFTAAVLGTAVSPPGLPVPRIEVKGLRDPDADNPNPSLNRGAVAVLSGTTSEFASQYKWSVTDVAGTPYTASGAQSQNAALSLDQYCRPRDGGNNPRPASEDFFTIQLQVQNGFGQSATATQTVPVYNVLPKARSVLPLQSVFAGTGVSVPFEDMFESSAMRPIGDGDLQYQAACAGGQCTAGAQSVSFLQSGPDSTGSISVTVTDCDGEFATATVPVEVISAPTAAPNATPYSVAVNAANVQPLTSVTQGDGVAGSPASPPVVELVQYQPKTACSVSPARIDCPFLTAGQISATVSSLTLNASGFLTYTPPKGVITRGTSGNTALPANDSFQYRFSQELNGQTLTTNTASESIVVAGSRPNNGMGLQPTFSSIRDRILRGVSADNPVGRAANDCLGCHGGSAANVAAKNRMCLSEPGNLCEGRTLYQSLVRNPGGNNATLRISVLNPGLSELYTFPEDPAHPVTLTTQELEAIRTWIAEGAWEN